MAETALGAIGLLGLYSACQDCFDQVQVARHCGEDYARWQIEVDLLNLRFTRWAIFAGLDEPDNQDVNNNLAIQSTSEGITVQETLEEIRNTFEKCRVKSEKYRSGLKDAQGNNDSLIAFDQDSNIKPSKHSVHNTIRTICRKTKGTGTKLRWAFYEQNRLAGLLVSLKDMVDSLTELYPASEATRHRIGEEVREICSGLVQDGVEEDDGQTALRELQDTAKGTDDLFAAQLGKVVAAAKNGYRIRNHLHDGKAFTLYGDHIEDVAMVGKGDGSAYDIEGGKHKGSSVTVYGKVYGKTPVSQ